METAAEPNRQVIDQLRGAVMLEFGAQWCGHCQAAQATIASALARFPQVRHICIEDGKGKRLGRTFTVKLWPTLIFMRDGIEQQRLVRQIDAHELNAALQAISQ